MDQDYPTHQLSDTERASLEEGCREFLCVALECWVEAHPFDQDENPWTAGNGFIQLAQQVLAEARPVQ